MIGRVLAIVLIVLIVLSAPVVGVYFACSCHRTTLSTSTGGGGCGIGSFLGWGMLAILGAALFTAVFFTMITISHGVFTPFYTAFGFLFTMVLLTFALTVIAASFVCSTSGTVWYNSIPVLVLLFFAFIHLFVQSTGKLRGAFYRYVFALSYTVLFTVSILLFFFTPALALIPDPIYSWIPFTVFVLLTFSGLYQSWVSPRPLVDWEVVTLDLPDLLGKESKTRWIEENHKALAERKFPRVSTEYFHLKQAQPLGLPRPVLGSISGEQLSKEEDLLWKSTVIAAQEGIDPSRVESKASSATTGGNGTSSTNNATTTDTLTVVQITDPHLGSMMTVDRLRECCERTVLVQPDLVFLTGDFFTIEAAKEPEALTTALAPLKKLPTPNRVFACYGNHDYESPDITAYTNAGVKSCGGLLLCDASTIVSTRAGLVEIIGINYHRDPAEPMANFFATRQSVAASASPSQPAAATICQRFVMLHDPKGFPFVPPELNAVVLSGHTHGGHLGLYQLGLPHATMVRLSGIPDNGEWTNVNYPSSASALPLAEDKVNSSSVSLPPEEVERETAVVDEEEGGALHTTSAKSPPPTPLLGNILYVHRGQGSRSDLSNALTRLGVPSEDSVLRVKVTGGIKKRNV